MSTHFNVIQLTYKKKKMQINPSSFYVFKKRKNEILPHAPFPNSAQTNVP